MRFSAMARYFLDLWECGKLTSDDEGVDLAGLEAARVAAVAGARGVMSAEIQQGRLCLGCCIDIRDSTGEVVLKVPFREAVEITG